MIKNNKILTKKSYSSKMIFLLHLLDINDSNIPNGNSIFLLNCKKLEIITAENKWKSMTKRINRKFSFLS